MAILIKDGEITGCQQNGHVVLCTNCQVSNTANCPDNESREKLPFKPIGTIYEKVALEIAKLVSEKQKQYGNSFNKAGEYLRLLYPDGIQLDQYDDMLGLIRDFDKSMRIVHGNQGNEDAWSDKLGYALLAVVRNKKSE